MCIRILPHTCVLIALFSSIHLQEASAARSLPASLSQPSGRMTVRTTAYTANEPNGGGSYSAMGNRLRYGGNLYSAASDWSWLPMGTVFRMKSNGRTYVIDDYGSALVGRQTIDLYTPNSRVMNSWGVRHMDIEIIKLGSYDRSLSLLESRQAGARYVRRMVAALRQRQAGAIAVLLAGGGASSGPLAP